MREQPKNGSVLVFILTLWATCFVIVACLKAVGKL